MSFLANRKISLKKCDHMYPVGNIPESSSTFIHIKFTINITHYICVCSFSKQNIGYEHVLFKDK